MERGSISLFLSQIKQTISQWDKSFWFIGLQLPDSWLRPLACSSKFRLWRNALSLRLIRMCMFVGERVRYWRWHSSQLHPLFPFRSLAHSSSQIFLSSRIHSILRCVFFFSTELKITWKIQRCRIFYCLYQKKNCKTWQTWVSRLRKTWKNIYKHENHPTFSKVLLFCAS